MEVADEVVTVVLGQGHERATHDDELDLVHTVSETLELVHTVPSLEVR